MDFESGLAYYERKEKLYQLKSKEDEDLWRRKLELEQKKLDAIQLREDLKKDAEVREVYYAKKREAALDKQDQNHWQAARYLEEQIDPDGDLNNILGNHNNNGPYKIVRELAQQANVDINQLMNNPLKHNNRDLYNITQYQTNPQFFLANNPQRKALLESISVYEKAASDRVKQDKELLEKNDFYRAAFGDIMSTLKAIDEGIGEDDEEIAARVDPDDVDLDKVVSTLVQHSAEVLNQTEGGINKFKRIPAATQVKTAALIAITKDLVEGRYNWQALGRRNPTTNQLTGLSHELEQIQTAISTHNSNLQQVEDRTMLEARFVAASAEAEEEKKKHERDREEKKEDFKAEAMQQLTQIITRLGLTGQQGQSKQDVYPSYKGYQPGPYAGAMGKQRYMHGRFNDMFGKSGGIDDADPEQEMIAAQAQEKYQNNVTHGKSATGNFGSAASAGTGLQKLASFDKKLTPSDLELLKALTVDKKTGLAMKIDAEGNVVQLSPEEKERAAFIIIEICLFIFAKHVKTASEMELSAYRKKMKETNTLDGEEELLQLLKVANVMANKSLAGSIDKSTVVRYVEGLAGGAYEQEDRASSQGDATDNSEKDMASDIESASEDLSEEEEEEVSKGKKRKRRERGRGKEKKVTEQTTSTGKTYYHRPRKPRYRRKRQRTE